MVGLKTKMNPVQNPQQTQISDQNSFYQNLSVYRNSGLGERYLQYISKSVYNLTFSQINL